MIIKDLKDCTGESDLAFLCIVDPAWKTEDEEVLQGPAARTR